MSGVGVGARVGAAVRVGAVASVPSAIAEGANVACGPLPVEKSTAPAMTTATRPMRPSPTRTGVELGRAGVGRASSGAGAAGVVHEGSWGAFAARPQAVQKAAPASSRAP